MMDLEDSEKKLVDDAMQSMRDAGVSYDNLLHYQAHDYVRSLRLKGRLADACQELAAIRAQRPAVGLTVPTGIGSLLDKVVALAEAATDSRFGEIVELSRKQQRRDTAKKANTASKAQTARAKEAIQKDWERWQVNRGDYTYKGDFARDMQRHFPIIKTYRTIVTWCGEWEKATSQLAN